MGVPEATQAARATWLREERQRSSVYTTAETVLEPFAFNPVMLWEPVAFVLLGALAGIIPAIKAYRTDVAQNLTPHS